MFLVTAVPSTFHVSTPRNAVDAAKVADPTWPMS